jgi:exopolysaccharide biosynthesis protein
VRKFLWIVLLGIATTGGALWWGRSRGETKGGALWTEIAPGVQMRRLRALDGSSAVSVVALRAAPARLHVGVGSRRNAGDWRRHMASIAAVNGGFFDPEGHSLGLRVARGQRVSRLRQADWGVFFVRHGSAHIVHTRDFTSRRGVSDAVQCGPRLVVQGRPIQLKPQWARRTGIGVQRDGRVVIAVADDALSFGGWAALWAARNGLNCNDALNLDGGGSTQLSLHTPERSVEIFGAVPVPDAVIIK